MVKKARLILLFFLILPSILIAQDRPEKSNITNILEKGDKAYSHGEYSKAIDLYKQVASVLKNDPDIEKRIGATLFKLDRYEEALPVLNGVKSESDTVDIYVDYFLAISLHNLGRYDEAIAVYESCLDYIDTKSIDSGEEEIKKRIAQCRFWKEISESPLDVVVTRLDSTINTPAPEYGAKIIGDSLMLFTSRRMSNIPIADLIMKPDEDVYVSELSEGKWQQAQKAGNNVNTSLNNAVLGVSPDGKNVFLYNDINTGDILTSKFNGKFYPPDTLRGQINTVEFTESAFTINASGDRCFFVSNRTDHTNYGGKDIFIATKNSDGTWGNVKNPGSQVNSKYDEDFVFWSDEDSALYFSSNRENSVGGFDIFISKTAKDGSLLPPENIGLPINTPLDDISFFKSGNKAWYSSTYQNNKEDIFEIKYNIDIYNPDWHLLTLDNITRINGFEAIENVYFQTGKNKVNTQDTLFLHLVDVLKRTQGAKIRLSGHSDWTGDEKMNDKLSFERAFNLADKLVSHGVDPKMLMIDFYGESNLQTDTVFTNDSLKEKAMLYNRCVEVSIEKQGNPYLYVNRPVPNGIMVHKEPKTKYAVMVYISDIPYKPYANSEDIIENYSEKEKLFYYHSDYLFNITKADQLLALFRKKYKNAYIFCLK